MSFYEKTVEGIKLPSTVIHKKKAAGKTWTWTYDDAGNITKKQEYNYPLGTGGTLLDTTNYTYGNSNWGDLLTAYDGHTITYDTVGNPLSDGTWTYTWEHGRELTSMTSSDTTATYSYNADGLRIKKTVDGVVHNYVYSGGKLVEETYGDTKLNFSYDANGNPYTFSYTKGDNSPSVYHYVLNLQGDVVRIVTNKGVTRVTYEYDAWGNITNMTCTNETLANANPLRYRGYYYDRETGLYYLQSRYYNPQWGRFINADNRMSGVGGEVSGYNLFSYCMNNPVNMSDPTGGWPGWLENVVKVASVAIAVTAVVVMVATVSAVSAGTAAPGALLGASVLLGAALSGINGGIANEANGNSYTNGYVGGATGGAIQAACSQTPAGTVVGGGAGVAVGTAITDSMNNLDPDSSNSSAQEVVSNAITSGGKALATSSLTAYIGYASDLSLASGDGLMTTFTFGFGEAVKAFFGWVDDALVYIWE